MKTNQELYGPLWIAVTLVIEFSILSHMIGALKLQSVISSSSENTQFQNDDLLTRFANQSLSRIFTISFLVTLMFLLSPFVTFLVFKNKGALEVTFIQLMQIFSYSLSIFIPLGFIHCVFYPLSRLRLLTTIAATGISLYYIYKETREYVVKYLEGADDSTLWNMKVFTGAMIGGFAVLFRYYFLDV